LIFKNRKNREAKERVSLIKKIDKRLEPFFTRLYLRLPDALTGESLVLKEKYAVLNYNASEEDVNAYLHKTKLFTVKTYMLCMFLVAVLVLVFLAKLGTAQFMPYEPSYEDVAKAGIDAKLKANYKGDSIDLDKHITIGNEVMSDAKEAEMLKETQKNLPYLILGENKSLASISNDLNLIEKDETTGVNISWQSESEEMINEKGEVNFINGKRGEEVYISAWLSLGGSSSDAKIKVRLATPSSGYNIRRAMTSSIDLLLGAISRGEEKVQKDGKLALPKETETGIRLDWSFLPAKLPILEIIILFAIGFAIYITRYRKLEIALAKKGDAMLRELPDFLSKLILLLDAGMVFTTAFDRITNTYMENKASYGDRTLYNEFINIKERVRVSNTPLIRELVCLADRSGKREMIRLMGIINDSMDKGTDLLEKLRQENSLMLELKRKLAEERGQLAETKLSGPMAIQLLVIVLIAVAPALLDMQ
jgi:hypothetical protein